jgi:hypothetical protein
VKTGGRGDGVAEREKVYIIGLRDGQHSYAVSRVERTEFLGIPCLKGSGAYSASHRWLHGKTVFIPVTEIDVITEFDSRGEHDAAMDMARSAGRGEWWRQRWWWIALIVLWLAFMVWAALQDRES